MDFPAFLSYGKTKSQTLITRYKPITNFSTRIPTKRPYYYNTSRAQSQPGIDTCRLVVKASTQPGKPCGDSPLIMVVSSVARAALTSLAMACIVGAFWCGFAPVGQAGPGQGVWSRMMSNTSSESDQEKKISLSTPVPNISTRSEALKAFFDVMVYLASPAANVPSPPRFNIRVDVYELKRVALEQIKNRKNVNVALKQMEMKRDEFSKSDPEGQHYVEMALVEILIFQGNYKKALEYRDFLEGRLIPSDIRSSLYKAIIYTMLSDDRKNQAEKCWNDFFQADAIPTPGDLDPNNSKT